MKRVKIYLRSIIRNKEKELALFDSERNGGINDLVTEAVAGSTIIWRTDYRSGIKSINNIYFKKGKDNVFGVEPRKRFFCSGFKIKIPKDSKGEEAYGIDYVTCDNKELSIDPFLRIKPPAD